MVAILYRPRCVNNTIVVSTQMHEYITEIRQKPPTKYLAVFKYNNMKYRFKTAQYKT